MSGEAVTVAIRVRPFKEDEIAEKQVCCVTMVRLNPQPLTINLFFRLTLRSKLPTPMKTEKRNTLSIMRCGLTMVLRKTIEVFSSQLSLTTVISRRLGTCLVPVFWRRPGVVSTRPSLLTAKLAQESLTLSLDTAITLVLSRSAPTNFLRESRPMMMTALPLKSVSA